MSPEGGRDGPGVGLELPALNLRAILTAQRLGTKLPDEPLERTSRGRVQLVDLLQHLWAPNDYFVQLVASSVIEIDGDQATARGLVHEEARGPNGRFYRNNAVSHDRLRRSADGWVFTSRHYEYLWLDLSEFGGDVFMSFPQLPQQ